MLHQRSKEAPLSEALIDSRMDSQSAGPSCDTTVSATVAALCGSGEDGQKKEEEEAATREEQDSSEAYKSMREYGNDENEYTEQYNTSIIQQGIDDERCGLWHSLGV